MTMTYGQLKQAIKDYTEYEEDRVCNEHTVVYSSV